MDNFLLSDGARLTGSYVSWRGREYGAAGIDLKHGRVPVYFVGENPPEAGFELDARPGEGRLPVFCQWVPLEEIERHFCVTTKGVWRKADFRLIEQSQSGSVLVDGPLKHRGARRPITWWASLPGFKTIDRDVVMGWVPFSEIADVHEEVRELTLP